MNTPRLERLSPLLRSPSLFSSGEKDAAFDVSPWDYQSWGRDEEEKRGAPSGFFGTRGKKGPSSGFFGMRGKKGPSSSGFFGTRGKKGPSGFMGVRGKKEHDTPEMDSLIEFLAGESSSLIPDPSPPARPSPSASSVSDFDRLRDSRAERFAPEGGVED